MSEETVQEQENPTTVLIRMLAEAQAEMPNPKKEREGQKGYQKYKYATLDKVLDIVKAPLNARGIFITQPTGMTDDGRMRVQTVVFRDGAQMVLDTKPFEYDSDPQEFGKRETYARRYSLLTAFGLAGEDDTDGDTGPKKAPGASARAATKATGKDKPETSPEERRKKMLAKCAQLAAKCIENGVSAGTTDTYMVSTFNVQTMNDLTDEQLVEFGKYLRDMEKKSAEEKARKEAQQ